MLAVSAGECKLGSPSEPGDPLAHLSSGSLRPGGKTVSHEGRVPLEVLGGDEGVFAPGDLQHGRVDGRTGVEGCRRQPATSAEPPPGPPGGAQEIERRPLLNAGAVAGDLPLDDEVGPDQGAGRIVEEAVQDRRGPAERRVRDHAIRRTRERHVAHVGMHDDHVGRGCEPHRQPPDERRVELDREYRRGTLGERRGQETGAGADVDDAVVARDTSVGNEPRGNACAIEKVLTESSSRRRAAADVPGPGKP